MLLSEKIEAFTKLGEVLEAVVNNNSTTLHSEVQKKYYDKFQQAVQTVHYSNAWFTPENLRFSFAGISENLKEENLKSWLQNYNIISLKEPKKIAVILAGNIPLVGFHDFLCIILSGNIFLGKLSSKDDKLLRLITGFLIEINTEFSQLIAFEEHILKNFDAVIATGSNNSARYFQYYFGKVPNIIRKNRNSVAVLSGNETPQQLENLADDIFIYFGLGCRNVSKIFLPENYDITYLIKHLEKYKHLKNHNKYQNNYEYNRAIYLVNQTLHHDNGFLLFKEDTNLSSPVSVVFYEFYNDIEVLKKTLEQHCNLLQCIVSETNNITNAVNFGKTQKPQLSDYADMIDTMDFLLKLNE